MVNILPFSTTLLGSFPHKELQNLCHNLVAEIDIPTWPQLPKRSFLENMYHQFSAPLPGIEIDYDREKVFFNTSQDLTDKLEIFYEHYLANDVDYFALPRNYAQGFYEFLPMLPSCPDSWVKGQVTGPISFGLTITDQTLRSSLYHDFLTDVITKTLSMNARWQIQQLKTCREKVIIFVDEPFMSSFGSAYINLSRDLVTAMLEEVFSTIHHEGALAGIHCCGNTDWSVLLETSVDILNLDAYDYLESLSLYPIELRRFLDRRGIVCWGLIPNNPMILQETAVSLGKRLLEGFTLIEGKANRRGITISIEELSQQSLLSPSCGLGSTTVDIAERTLVLLSETAKLLRNSL
jgi:hypothetical protein